jgi:hypothetical protein
MVVESDLASLSIPLKFLSFSDAYLDSASRLCTVLKRSPKKSNYARGSVVLYLAFHAIELFLKSAILERNPNEKLGNHDIEVLSKRYKKLYPGMKYEFHPPFISRNEIDLSDFFSPEIIEEVKANRRFLGTSAIAILEIWRGNLGEVRLALSRGHFLSKSRS